MKRNCGTQIAVVNPAKQILVSRRAATLEEFPSFLQFPGGRLEEGESLYDGAARELREELGIEVTRWTQLFTTMYCPPRREPYELTSFVVQHPALFWSLPNPEPEKCGDWFWASTNWLLYQTDLMDGMRPTIHWLMDQWGD